MSVGFQEILLIAIFVLLLFGAKRIPELARAFGRAIFEFNKAKQTLQQESREFMNAAEDAGKAQDAKNAAPAAEAKPAEPPENEK